MTRRKKPTLPDWRDRDLRTFHECEVKTTYDSPGAAERGIKGMKKAVRSLQGQVHVYRCTRCKKWHIGQVSQKLRFPRKKERRRAGLAQR